MKRLVFVWLWLPLLLPALGWAAATLTVGPGKMYSTPCDAIAQASPGDTIEVDASGDYDGDTCAWSTDNLTVRGVGGRAKIDLTGVTPAQEKGIFTISAANATLESLELSGAAVSVDAGNNGAAIRHQGLNLTVRDCYLHDNQNGILGAPSTDGQGIVLIERSELAQNGAGDGFSHNLYLNHYARVTIVSSYSHGARVGHLVKSRARENFILGNRLTDEPGTTASYEIDLPNGGASYIIGNLIEQAAASQNPTIVTSGEEGTTNPDQQLYFINNTVVNTRDGGTFVNLASGTTGLIQNNIFVGTGTLSLAGATQVSNWDDAAGDPRLVAPASYDYHLRPDSPCIDQGTTPGPGLVPEREYVHVASFLPRVVAGARIDIGAYEAPAAGGGPDAGPDANPSIDARIGVPDAAGTSDAGALGPGATGASAVCGCGATGNGPAGGGWLLLVGLATGRSRRRSQS